MTASNRIAVRFVLFRYQVDLMRDKWWPLGIVAEHRFTGGTQIGVVCLESPVGPVAQKAASELASAILQDVPAILRREIEECRTRIAPGEDFLEGLRRQNPWNFHFTAPEQTEVEGENEVLGAAMWLFTKRVMQSEQGEESLRPRMSPNPQKMEYYAVAV